MKANFNLYCQSLTELMPFLFAKKHCKLCTIYSCPLQRQYDLAETTADGSGVLNWNGIVHKSSRQLSTILEHSWCWSIWMVTGPEVTCLITQQDTACTTKEAAIMSTKSPRSSRTFEEYAIFDVLSTIEAHSAKHNRTDIVLDIYWSKSVKIEAKST